MRRKYRSILFENTAPDNKIKKDFVLIYEQPFFVLPMPNPVMIMLIFVLNLRCATASVARVQRAITDGVASAQPGEETLQTETVATVGGGTVPGIRY
jgi:hypothetical protein